MSLIGTHYRHTLICPFYSEVRFGYVAWDTGGEHVSQDLPQQFDSGTLTQHTSLKCFFNYFFSMFDDNAPSPSPPIGN